MRVLTFCVMPNHFHLALWPNSDVQLQRFMHWLTTVHALRWRAATNTVGEGAVYQGRYKAIPVQTDNHFITLARYVERNPVRAGLCARPEHWRWSALWHRDVVRDSFPLAAWPVTMPVDWVALVGRPQARKEVATVRRSVAQGCALGNAGWQDEMAKNLRIPGYFRGRGRPRSNPS